MTNENDILVFGGSASRNLTEKICAYIGIEPGKNETIRHPDGNLFVRVKENVRGRHVHIVQSIGYQPNDCFMELLFWLDALRRSSAESITAVIPYFSYARGDKKDQPRVSIRARVCADALEAAGADRAVFVDLHSPQEQGFFRIPVDDLYSMPVLCRRAMRQREGDMVVVAPDPGIIKKARGFASALQVATAIANQPTGPGEKTEIIGDVAGKTALIVDDFVISGETLFDTAAALRENGAQRVYAAVTHAAPTLEGMRRLQASAIERILTTDTVECHPQPLPERFEAVSLAPLLGEAIRRIHNKESLSVLFPPPDAQIAVFEESMAAWPGALESGHDRR